MAELNYPLGEHHRDAVRSQTGRRADELTVDGIKSGAITSADAAVDPGTLLLQADFAERGGNPQLAENLRRGAELASFSDDDVLRFLSRKSHLLPLETGGHALSDKGRESLADIEQQEQAR